MSERVVETRTVTVLSRGTRASVVVALLFVVASVYFLIVPLERSTQSGVPFRCGTALSPAEGSLASSVCIGTVRRQRLLSGGMGAAAVIVAAGGVWTFGASRRVQRHIRDDDDLFAGGTPTGGA